MKKILALLLAALMLLSCTALAAFDPLAKGGDAIYFSPEVENDNSKLDIHNNLISRYQKEDVQDGKVETELWLQIEASGQIDVTVPLVLVFSTNVDGGYATAADNYKIYNNNTRNSIAIDKIEVEIKSDGENLLNLKTDDDFYKLTPNDRDYYSVVMKPFPADKEKTVASGNQEANKALAMNTQVHAGYDFIDLAKAVVSGNSKTAYDTTGTTKEATQNALMTLGQGGIINLKPTMKTTPLSFVTSEADTKGVHLLNVTYTVGLQYTQNDGSDLPTEHRFNTLK